MERYRTKKGFTLIEMLIGAAILVIVMALICIFFVKASKIRSAVSKENNTQVIAGQMMNAVMSGISQLSEGLMYATSISAVDDTHSDSPLWITFVNGSATTTIAINPEGSALADTPLIQTTAAGGKNLDPNYKISLTSGSWFGCYDSQDRNVFTVYPTSGDPANIELRRAATSKIEICLVVKDKNLPESLPFVLRNTVTLKNIPHID